MGKKLKQLYLTKALSSSRIIFAPIDRGNHKRDYFLEKIVERMIIKNNLKKWLTSLVEYDRVFTCRHQIPSRQKTSEQDVQKRQIVP